MEGRNDEGEVWLSSRCRQIRTWSCRYLRADLREGERPQWEPDLAISAHLMTEAEIDDFVNNAIVELEEIRLDAKKALAAAASH